MKHLGNFQLLNRLTLLLVYVVQHRGRKVGPFVFIHLLAQCFELIWGRNQFPFYSDIFRAYLKPRSPHIHGMVPCSRQRPVSGYKYLSRPAPQVHREITLILLAAITTPNAECDPLKTYTSVWQRRVMILRNEIPILNRSGTCLPPGLIVSGTGFLVAKPDLFGDAFTRAVQ